MLTTGLHYTIPMSFQCVQIKAGSLPTGMRACANCRKIKRNVNRLATYKPTPDAVTACKHVLSCCMQNCITNIACTILFIIKHTCEFLHVQTSGNVAKSTA